MALISYGEITVPVPGTPVRVTTDTNPVHAMYFQARGQNTKVCHVGLSTLTKATGVGVLMRVAAPSGGTDETNRTNLPAESFGNAYAPGSFDPSTIYIDAEIADEGLLVTAEQT